MRSKLNSVFEYRVCFGGIVLRYRVCLMIVIRVCLMIVIPD